MDTVRGKYASELIHGVYDIHESKPGDHTIRISGKNIEEVGFEKVRRQIANLKQLRIIVVDTLRINRPEARSQIPGPRPFDITNTCPRVWELDISRNLFETWAEIIDICRQLPRLTNLRADGNRITNVTSSIYVDTLGKIPFTQLKELSLSDTLLHWDDVAGIAQHLPVLSILTANGNEYQQLSDAALPSRIEVLYLERNEFQSFEALKPVAKLQSLRSMSLRENPIDRTTDSGMRPQDVLTFPVSLVEINIPYCCIHDWSLIDDLGHICPGLTSLRVAHNPLFESLISADGDPLTPDDGYMLTLARLGQLTRLNFSAITPKERLNAELYYLSQIKLELSLVSDDQAPMIVGRHPRYQELCSFYSQPDQRIRESPSVKVDPKSLTAYLVTITFRIDVGLNREGKLIRDTEKRFPWSCEVPRSFNIYKAAGMVAKRLSLAAHTIQLLLDCSNDDVPYEQDESDKLSGGKTPNVNAHRCLQAQEPGRLLTPLIRALGTFIEGNKATIWVQKRPLAAAK